MKVSSSMIEKGYRLSGNIANTFTANLNDKKVKRLNKMTDRLKKNTIKGFSCLEVNVPSRDPGRYIRAKIYRPFNSHNDIPGILYLHGGGFLINTPETEHAMIEHFLKEKECVIVAPDYRKSLDAPYPAALYDSYDCLEWMVENADNIGFRTDQVFTIGCSAGGNLVAALNLLARDLGDINIAYQVPLYPMLDDRMTSISMKDNNAPMWNEENNRYAWNVYKRNIKSDQVPVYAAPGRNLDFTNLPPATTYIGTLDPFYNETIDYMNNLRAVGIRANYKIIGGVYHSFEMVNPSHEKSIEAFQFLMREFNYAVRHYFKPQPTKS